MNERLPTQLEEYIKSITKKEGYQHHEIKCKNLLTNGGSFVGILYEIDIIGVTQNGHKEINIFVKSKEENRHMTIYSISNCFLREAFLYKDVSKFFVEIQNEAYIPEDERFKIAKSFDETDSNSLILENLSKRGFKVYPKMDLVSFEYAELSIKQLAKFHALSFVLQEKRPKYFEEKIKPMNPLFHFGKDWKDYIQNMFNYSINCLESDVKKSVEEINSKKIHDYEKYMNDTSGVRTLCHGDYKHNNIMAKGTNGTLLEVIPVDYQLLHYGCPILDFLYFIFNGTDQTFRRKHLTHLKDLYHKTMKTYLGYFDIDVEAVYGRNDFETDFKEKLDFGLIFNVFFVPFLFASEEDVPDISKRELSTLAFNVDKRFTERFRGIVDDFVQWGYI